jgi:pyrroline-5-carboxylate reductase
MSRLAEVAMDLFVELFGSMLAFVYHCFDRIVIHGYLSSLSRPEQVVYFFRRFCQLSGQVRSGQGSDY